MTKDISIVTAPREPLKHGGNDSVAIDRFIPRIHFTFRLSTPNTQQVRKEIATPMTSHICFYAVIISYAPIFCWNVSNSRDLIPP